MSEEPILKGWYIGKIPAVCICACSCTDKATERYYNFRIYFFKIILSIKRNLKSIVTLNKPQTTLQMQTLLTLFAKLQ